MFVVTADQRDSRRGPDRVPAALAAVARVAHPEPPAERTAGDELQVLLRDASEVVHCVEALTRLDGWRIGVGIGAVEAPIPASVRAARGPAFVAAREAVESARSAPTGLSVRADSYGDDVAGGERQAVGEDAHHAESALWLLIRVLRSRSAAGWQAVDLLEAGHRARDVAAALGISESAVSQRLRAAGLLEGRRAAELAVVHLSGAAARA